MKNFKFLATILFATILFVSCSDNDPEVVHEEEVITTITITLTPNGGGGAITLQSQDLDGDGPNPPVVTDLTTLAAGTTYNGTIVLLNETESPAENITEEVEELNLEHQFFYTVSGGLNATTAYTNLDDNGNPLGTEFTLTTSTASTGTVTFTLIHEPTKPNTGLNDAGGEADITATFNVTVQ